MKAIFKNFINVIRHFKVSSILTLLSLSMAFAIFTVIMIQVHYDFSFDKHFKKSEDIVIYRAHHNLYGGDYWWTNTPLAKKIAEKAPQVQNYTIIGWTDDATKIRVYAENEENPYITAVDRKLTKGFIDMFEPEVVEGDIENAMSDYNNVFITETLAKTLFKEKPAIDQSIQYGTSNPYKVTAVIKDFPKNSSFTNGVYRLLYDNDDPTEGSFTAYYEVKKSNQQAFIDFLNSEDFLGKEQYKKVQEDKENNFYMHPIPLLDVHLHVPEKGTGNLTTTLALLGIAIVTLVIAYVNFINFSIAMGPARVRPLNIQRILGNSKLTQYITIAAESALFSICAYIVAIFLISFLQKSPIHELFDANISLSENTGILIILGIAAIFIGFLFGLYPAKYITTFDTIKALNGRSSGIRSSKLRTILITFQFIATIVLLIVALFIKVQHDYMVNYSWGIEKEQIAFFPRQSSSMGPKRMGEELIKDPRIKDYTTSRYYPGSESKMNWGRNFKGKQVNFVSWPVRDNFLDFFGIKVIAGKSFPEVNNPDKHKVLFNEAFLKEFEFTADDILGAEVFFFKDNGEVMGIMENVNFETLKLPIRPMAIVTIDYQFDDYMFVKFAGHDIKGAIQFIEDT